CCDDVPQKFTRVLNASVGLGILPDAGKSSIAVRWAKPHVQFDAVVRDALGNIPDPTTASLPELLVNGTPMDAKVVNHYTGTYVIDLPVEGDEVKIDAKHKIHVTKGWALSKDGKRVDLAEGKLKWAIRLGAVDLEI